MAAVSAAVSAAASSAPVGVAADWLRAVLARYRLPGLNSLLSRAAVAGFSPAYLLDLLQRFINWEMIGAAFVLLVIYLFVAQWIRVTVLVSLALIWLNVLTLAGPAVSLLPSKAAAPPVALNDKPAASPAAAGLDQSAPPTSANLTAWLNRFYDSERQRVTHFPDALPADSQPFDILVINICSLAWSDIDGAAA